MQAIIIGVIVSNEFDVISVSISDSTEAALGSTVSGDPAVTVFVSVTWVFWISLKRIFCFLN